jgi:hypothetical protein
VYTALPLSEVIADRRLYQQLILTAPEIDMQGTTPHFESKPCSSGATYIELKVLVVAEEAFHLSRREGFLQRRMMVA